MKETTPEINDDEYDRNHILKLLIKYMDYSSDKISNSKFRSEKNENLRIKYIRALSNLANTYNRIQHDKQLDEILEQLKIFNETVKLNAANPVSEDDTIINETIAVLKEEVKAND